MKYVAAFQGRTRGPCTNLDFFDGPKKTHTLLFDAAFGDDRKTPIGVFRLEFFGVSARLESATWYPEVSPESWGWFANAQRADNGCIPAFLDWLTEHAPDGLRREIEEIVARGVVPLANPRREGDVEATANAGG